MKTKDKTPNEVHSEPLQKCSVSRSIFKGIDYFFQEKMKKYAIRFGNI